MAPASAERLELGDVLELLGREDGHDEGAGRVTDADAGEPEVHGSDVGLEPPDRGTGPSPGSSLARASQPASVSVGRTSSGKRATAEREPIASTKASMASSLLGTLRAR